MKAPSGGNASSASIDEAFYNYEFRVYFKGGAPHLHNRIPEHNTPKDAEKLLVSTVCNELAAFFAERFGFTTKVKLTRGLMKDPDERDNTQWIRPKEERNDQ